LRLARLKKYMVEELVEATIEKEKKRRGRI
jgi:hypothetical protein